MTLIDEKGRVFSKINLFDLFILIILLVVLIFGVSKIYKRYFVKQQFESYTMLVRATNVDEIVAKSITKGMIIKTPSGSKFGEISTAPVIKPTQVYVTTPQGVLIARTQPKLKDADFELIVQVPKGSREIRYGTQVFQAGATGFIESDFTKYTIQILSITPYTQKPVPVKQP
jgi:hypothetical protein